MDKEYHYYVNYIIAKIGGFSNEDAEIISYSAQYTDDNKKKYIIHIDDGAVYQNDITQTFDITLDQDEVGEIYRCYHFQPSYQQCTGKEEDLLVTQAGSNFCKMMISEAMLTKNPYIIGIASHAFCDSYAHHRFCAHSSVKNNPLGIDGIPNYGHMYFGELPDLISVTWKDIRYRYAVDNNKRFIKASLDLLQYYLEYNGKSVFYSRRARMNLKSLLLGIWGESQSYFPNNVFKIRSRVVKYRHYLSAIGCNIELYNVKKWTVGIIKYVQSSHRWWALKDTLYNSHWYHFQEAAKVYKKIFHQKELEAKESIDQKLETE